MHNMVVQASPMAHASCKLSVSCGVQEAAEQVLSQYSSQLQKLYEGHMAQKLGMQQYDKDLTVGLMSNMYEDQTGRLPACSAFTCLDIAKSGVGFQNACKTFLSLSSA